MKYFVCYTMDRPSNLPVPLMTNSFFNETVPITLPNPDIVGTIKNYIADKSSYAVARYITIISMCPLPE